MRLSIVLRGKVGGGRPLVTPCIYYLRWLRCTVLGASHTTIAVVVLAAVNFAMSIFVQYNVVNLLLAPWLLLLLVNGETTCTVCIMVCIAVLLSLVINVLLVLVLLLYGHWFALLESVVLVVVLEGRLLPQGLFIWLRKKVVFLHVVLWRWRHLSQVSLQELAFHGLLGALCDNLRPWLVVDLVIVDSSELLGRALLHRVGL